MTDADRLAHQTDDDQIWARVGTKGSLSSIFPQCRNGDR